MRRPIAGKLVHPIGLGCRNLSHPYGPRPPHEARIALLHRALDLGVEHFDTAAMYGAGENEQLLGEALKPVRSRVTIASKSGMHYAGATRVIDGRPEVLERTCEETLRRLQTDHVDLYYLHRVDRSVPVEDSVGALSQLIRKGKIGAIGLSEVSAATLLRAHREHPIVAVQSEYSLWTRNPEIDVLKACREIGAAFVAFSPLARGYLAGGIGGGLRIQDARTRMPGFQEPNLSRNINRFRVYAALARNAGLTPAQLALAWTLSRGDHVHVIPGTTNVLHMEENMLTPNGVGARVLAEAEAIINENTIHGTRYPAAVRSETDAGT